MNSKQNYVRPVSIKVDYALMKSVAKSAEKMDKSLFALHNRGLFSIVNWSESQRAEFAAEDYLGDIIHLPMIPFYSVISGCLDDYKDLSKSDWKRCGVTYVEDIRSILNPNSVALALDEVFTSSGLHYARPAYAPRSAYFDAVNLHRYDTRGLKLSAVDYPLTVRSRATDAALKSDDDNTIVIGKAIGIDLLDFLFNHDSRKNWENNVKNLRLVPHMDVIDDPVHEVSAPFVWLNVGRVIGRKDAVRVCDAWTGVLADTASHVKSDSRVALVDGTIAAMVDLMFTDFMGEDYSHIFDSAEWFGWVARLQLSFVAPPKQSTARYWLGNKLPEVLNAKVGVDWLAALSRAIDELSNSSRAHITLITDSMSREMVANLFCLKVALIMSVGYVYGQAEVLNSKRSCVVDGNLH